MFLTHKMRNIQKRHKRHKFIAMKIKKTKKSGKVEKIEEIIALLKDDEKRMIDGIIVADFIYDSVIDQLNIPKDDEVYKNLVYGVLTRQTKDHIVFAIWNNLTPEQSKHLRDFVGQVLTVIPGLNHEDIMMEFAQMYPDLMEKVYESLSGFFKDFIEKFNEINGA